MAKTKKVTLGQFRPWIILISGDRSTPEKSMEVRLPVDLIERCEKAEAEMEACAQLLQRVWWEEECRGNNPVSK